MLVGRSECAPDEREAVIVRRYCKMREREQFSLYRNKVDMGYLVIMLTGTDKYEPGDYTYSICIKPEQTYIANYAGSSNGWVSDSNVKIFIDNKSIFYICI